LSHPNPPSLPGSPKEIDPIEQAMLALSYGVHVIGSVAAGGALNAMLADWVMQVSFEPRLVAVAIENDARTLRFIRETKVFSVNLLHQKDGADIARQVVMPAEGSKIRGRSSDAGGVVDKLAGLDYGIHDNGCAILDDALGWFTCDAEQFLPSGDHTIVVGRVTDGAVVRVGEMLIERELGWEYAG
jgi:flavin reductase (DIM6/NTAB) family NADH-FMN oxidoreductase RutF